MPAEYISDKAICDRVFQEMIIEADRYLWIRFGSAGIVSPAGESRIVRIARWRK